jgi:NADPH-dependent curcumin reductase CurA
MASVNRQFVLGARPRGLPRLSDFELRLSPVSVPGNGEFLVQTIYLSVDPYMRGRMTDRVSYAPPVAIGAVMVGSVVGRVIASNHPEFPVGTIVEGHLGWQDFAIGNGKGVRKLDPTLAPISTALGVLGMPGWTAYFGLLNVGQPVAGETVVVSGAAGAVGSLVGQIARIKGCRVVGVAGSDTKVDMLTHEFGFDGAFNYKTEPDFVARLRQLCPRGVDVYFDNVGGPLTDAVFSLLNVHARVSVCGQISQYNADLPELGPRPLLTLIETRSRVQGFLVTDYAPRFKEATAELAAWLKAGTIQYRETIVDGLENAPRAFLDLFGGKNVGKQLVKVSQE